MGVEPVEYVKATGERMSIGAAASIEIVTFTVRLSSAPTPEWLEAFKDPPSIQISHPPGSFTFNGDLCNFRCEAKEKGTYWAQLQGLCGDANAKMAALAKQRQSDEVVRRQREEARRKRDDELLRDAQEGLQ